MPGNAAIVRHGYEALSMGDLERRPSSPVSAAT
jgi:hypothetical protein